MHDRAPLFIIGPCSLESREISMRVAEFTAFLLESLDHPSEWVFKGSFLKDNRTSHDSYRGPGMDEGLRILEEISGEFSVRTLTDIHNAQQAVPTAQVVDIIQIPAFLCRQTSILQAAGATGKPLNIKKGQFMNPENMRGAVAKAVAAGCPEIWLTERGTFFGYGDLVVDFRSLSVMSGFSQKVILDVTHSLQRPGAAGGISGGCREFAPALARAGAAWGVDGLFIETHPDPSSALSDSATMVDFDTLDGMVRKAVIHWEGR
ncbi:MAG: 3-deoxy-8-phosphooctulonate synthase [Candidatus Aegiribacteria sp.]|nr:3-deoxy-8-phosphooctulonate synthase [Candidatus Aegiribacteria sp.]